jgi:ABC-type dipeptide/oligopeptide/nickel transport system ATPase component
MANAESTDVVKIEDLQFNLNYSNFVHIVGISGVGKTQKLCEILLSNFIFNRKDKIIYYFYEFYQKDPYDKLKQFYGDKIKFIQSFSMSFMDEPEITSRNAESETPCIFVFDDQDQNILRDKRTAELFTQYLHQ